MRDFHHSDRVSATEVASVVHANEHKSRALLFKEKSGLVPVRVPFNCEAVQHGIYWEPRALDWFFHRYPFLEGLEVGTILHPIESVSCSPDCLVVPTDLVNPSVWDGIEVKVPFTRPIPQTRDEIDPAHLLQAFTCLHVVPRSRCWYLLYFYPEDPTRSTIWQIDPSHDAWLQIVSEVDLFLEQVKAGDLVRGLARKRKLDGDRVKEFILDKIPVNKIV